MMANPAHDSATPDIQDYQESLEMVKNFVTQGDDDIPVVE